MDQFIKDKPNRYFHVTPNFNYESIKSKGLIPKIGRLSSVIDEKIPAVYMFHKFRDMEQALSNWLGEALNIAFGEDAELIICVIDFPEGTSPDYTTFFETVIYDEVPPEYITFYTEDYIPIN